MCNVSVSDTAKSYGNILQNTHIFNTVNGILKHGLQTCVGVNFVLIWTVLNYNVEHGLAQISLYSGVF